MKQSLWQRLKNKLAAYRRHPSWHTFVGVFLALAAWRIVEVVLPLV